MPSTKVAVIGSGFAGLAAAAVLSKEGFDVTVFEKNSLPGGRARKFEANNFIFDMGPSWYWMPEVFEKYFNRFDKSASDYYDLVRLDPSYRVYFGKNDFLDIPSGVEALCKLFDQLETGSSKYLLQFLEEGKYKYEIGINKLVHKPGLSVTELLDPELFKGVFKLHVFQSIAHYIRKFFKEPRIIKLLEFPVLFLGATPQKTPALYSLMNYADMVLGTWYPMGGMYKIIEGMVNLAREQGVKFKFDNEVQKFEMNGAGIKGVWANNSLATTNYVVAGADYHHVEQELLPERYRRYSKKYWESRTMAPSSLIFYLGINKRIHNLAHHTLFFDQDFTTHAREIYDDPQWPTSPQFYVSCPSKTDTTIAPAGCENIMILIPVAPGLYDDESLREKYFQIILERMESVLGENIKEHIVYKRSYAHNDFTADYNAFRGNAYGLANTLWQTANLKPGILNKKINNLFYTGQLTVPGPGVPPALISGQLVAKELIRQNRTGKLS
jgi:phytoene desaturase